MDKGYDLAVAVPAGIGDVSWIYSKLVTLGRRIKIYTPDTYPQRTYQWLHLLPNVVPALGKHGYNDILVKEMQKNYASYRSWQSILDSYEGEEVIYLQPNQWFLSGKTLEEWMPDLGTDFHYPMSITDLDTISGAGKLTTGKDDNGFDIGIHMACIKGVRSWNAWLPEDWVKFMEKLSSIYPQVRFVLMGGHWDIDMGMEVQGRASSEVKILDLIGKTNIGEAITILKKLHYYVGFSSGLNVMMNVLNKPCTALWPKHHREHMYCHADPQMVADRTYMGFVYDEPERIIERIKPVLKTLL